MALGQLPLLTKGGVALMLGGKEIIPLLSEGVPGRAMLLVQLCSAFFQLFIHCYKKMKVRKLVSYTFQLQNTVFESSLNFYGLNIIILSKLCKYFMKCSPFFSAGSCLGVITESLHRFLIAENNTSEIEDNIEETVFPKLIWIYNITFTMLIGSSFSKSQALRLN